MLRRLLPLLAILLIIPASSEAVIVTVGPADCSASTVNSAIAKANNGDTIKLTCTGIVKWTSEVKLSGGKTLLGPGSFSSNSWPLIIDCTGGAQSTILSIANAPNQPLNRVSGLEFQNFSSPANFAFNIYGHGLGESPYLGSYRIDNCYFNAINNVSRLMWINSSAGEMTGLIDHNVFYDTKEITPLEGYIPTIDGKPSSMGQDAWDRPFNFGDSHWSFYEDNKVIIDSSAVWAVGVMEAGWGAGAKFVVRHNNITCSAPKFVFDWAGGHGPDVHGVDATGTRGIEIYDNTLAMSNGCMGAITFRGGSYLMFNNVVTPGNGAYIHVWEDRASTSEIGVLDYSAKNHYVACEQAPQSGDLSKCWPLPYGISACGSINGLPGGSGNVTKQCPGQWGTILWNNSNIMPLVADNGPNTTYVQPNREFWVASSGPKANLPSTCTADGNTWYGTTDTDQLYKCTAQNIWTLEYTAFQYPHPLSKAGAAITPPSNLHISP